MISIDAILDDFISGRENEPFFKKLLKGKLDRRNDYLEKQSRGFKVRDGIKTSFWTEIIRPSIEEKLREGIAFFLRPDSLTKSESELKAVMSRMQSLIGMVGELKYYVEDGNDASRKLSEMSHEAKS